jgi:hypothetical protein
MTYKAPRARFSRHRGPRFRQLDSPHRAIRRNWGKYRSMPLEFPFGFRLEHDWNVTNKQTHIDRILSSRPPDFTLLCPSGPLLLQLYQIVLSGRYISAARSRESYFIRVLTIEAIIGRPIPKCFVLRDHAFSFIGASNLQRYSQPSSYCGSGGLVED